jgi:hypothetical protein
MVLGPAGCWPGKAGHLHLSQPAVSAPRLERRSLALVWAAVEGTAAVGAQEPRTRAS